MEVKFDKTKSVLVITLPVDVNGYQSATGKSLIHASSGGNQPQGISFVGGKPIRVGVNVYTDVRK